MSSERAHIHGDEVILLSTSYYAGLEHAPAVICDLHDGRPIGRDVMFTTTMVEKIPPQE